MMVRVPSFAKINLGLRIGPLRPDGFHELRTVYQTIALHDQIRVSITRGSGIEIRSGNPQVPLDATNTCHKIAERAADALKCRGRVVIEIEKHLPVQGGLGGASGNAVSALVALERLLGKTLAAADRLRIAAEVGSDLPLFLIGGTVLGVGRGEEVYPLPDLPPAPCVLATPGIAISTPQAFADWDCARDSTKLTASTPSDRINVFSSAVFLGLSDFLSRPDQAAGRFFSGVPAMEGRGRAETQLLDLVRTGMANDFERVVFPQHPELAQVKHILEAAGASYASLSGSGSAIYGFFSSAKSAEKAAAALQAQGIRAHVTTTVTQEQYWKQLLVAGAEG